ncbi:hypothetical protein SAMN05660909_04570 [Chitinophaga terrae (ex Kim and Jung 2007)]|uniref:Uncharacterized protein n=1 Tax=Chitinophaga terrae (ex Kim and Jung 2007) TaxID=408074 RepID=A0A1H4FQY1_9BACT|nr:hypothetical protein SAMN05660909_04570 [Chitinophaga terrae (ex Kim and Jung 2007)]
MSLIKKLTPLKKNLRLLKKTYVSLPPFAPLRAPRLTVRRLIASVGSRYGCLSKRG